MKKRVLALILACSMTAVLFGCGQTKEASSEASSAEESVEAESDGVVGGWTIQDEEVQNALPEEVQEAFDKAMEGYTGMSLNPICYMGSQVVAGANYMILCKGAPVVPNAETKLVVAIVYKNTSGDCEMKSVVDFDLGAISESESEGTEANVAGGWTVYGDQPVVNMEADAAKAFDQAMEGMTGAGYEPLALLGTQVVSGVNYAVLCRETLVTANPVTKLAVAFVYAPLSGNAEVTKIAPLDLASFNN